MKKLLITLSLILSLVLVFGACDVDKNENETGTNAATEADVPEENVGAIEDSINAGTNIGDIVNNAQESIDLEELFGAIEEAFEGFELEAELTATDGEEDFDVYIGYKDSVWFVDASGDKTYTFIEDDLMLVTVSDYGEGYEGYVDDSLSMYYEMISMFLDGLEGSDDAETDDDAGIDLDGIFGDGLEGVMGSVDTEKLEEFITALSEMTLPEIGEDDITYEGGKYYISDEYVKNAVDTAIEKVLTEYAKLFPDEMADSYIENAKETFGEYYDMLGFTFWLNARNEEIVGFGFEIDPDEELWAEFEADIESAFVSIDMSDKGISLEAEAEGEDGQSASVAYTVAIADNNVTVSVSAMGAEGEDAVFSVDASTAIALGENGEVISISSETNAAYPFSTGDYTDDDTYVHLDAKMVETNSYSIDFSKLEQGGEFLDLGLAMTISGFEAYVYDDNYDLVLDEALTAEYANGVKQNNVSVKGTSNGDEINFTASLTSVDTVMDINETITAEATVRFEATNMPEIPAEVESARQEAIDDYENGNWFDPDWDLPDDWESGWYGDGDYSVNFEDFTFNYEDYTFDYEDFTVNYEDYTFDYEDFTYDYEWDDETEVDGEDVTE